MKQAVISGTGLFTPPHSISNEELVASLQRLRRTVQRRERRRHRAGERTALETSSVGFIEKASGIKSRYVMDKTGILDPSAWRRASPSAPTTSCRCRPRSAWPPPTRRSPRRPHSRHDIDMVLVACSNMQRAYPAMAVEVQDALGIDGFGFDMNVACSSATFGIQTGGRRGAERPGARACWWSTRRSPPAT